MLIDDKQAGLYATWFGCLADANRLRILSLLSEAGRPMPIREIVDELKIGQPTVSHHVKHLEKTRFVHCERRGASTLVRVNKRCLRAFPSAAAIVTGTVAAGEAPWAERAA
jgi:DNA-binding transcriptional ArsR family regulator